MRYTTLLIDLDHTLFDSDESERRAFSATLRGFGVDSPERHFSAYRAINAELWGALERGEILPNAVGVKRFERLVEQAGLEADAEAMSVAYARGLGDFGDLYPGARDVLATVASGARLALITNGLADVQRARIERLALAEYFDAVVISSEVGASKPDRRIFDATFQALGSRDRESALILGDSLTSDMRGGLGYGIDACWYNPRGKSLDGHARPSFEIESLAQFPDLVVHGAI